MPALYADKRDPLVGQGPDLNSRLTALHPSGWVTLGAEYKKRVKVVLTICKLNQTCAISSITPP